MKPSLSRGLRGLVPLGSAVLGALVLAGACGGTDLALDRAPEAPAGRTDGRTAASAQPVLETIVRLEEQGTDGDGRLADLLARGEEPVRERAATALGRLPFPDFGSDVTDALVDALGDESPDVRAAAAFALGLRRDPASAPALLAHWSDPDERVRARLVEAASRFDDRKLREEVLYALNDPSIAVRSEAAVAPHRWATDLPDASVVDTALAEKAVPVRKDAAPEDPEVVWRALFSLQHRKAERGRDAFLLHARSKDARARIFAVRGLGNLAEPADASAIEPALGALRGALADADWRVACEAAISLGKHPDPGSIPALEGALGHTSAHVRRTAAEALGSFGAEAEAARRALAAAREDASSSVRAAALESEARIAKDDFAEELQSAGTDRDPVVRAGAAAAARNLSSDRAVPILIELTRDPSARVAEIAIEGLGAHPTDASRARILELLSASDNGLRLSAVQALETSVRAEDLPYLLAAYDTSTGDGADEIAFNVLECAGSLGNVAAPLVQHGLEHPSAYVRRTARDVLSKADPGTPLPAPAARPRAASPSAGASPVPAWDPSGRNPQVEVSTSRGILVFELFPGEAPVHVHNFLELARADAYDGTSFHRVVPDFVVQGGDYRGDGNGSRTWRGTPLRREFTSRKFVRGALGMPRNEDPDSGGSQIFVTHRETPHLDGRYTLFGQLVDGFDVLDALEVGDVILDVRPKPLPGEG